MINHRVIYIGCVPEMPMNKLGLLLPASAACERMFSLGLIAGSIHAGW